MGSKYSSVPLKDLSLLIKRGIGPKYVEDGGVLVINQRCIRDQRIQLENSRRNDLNKKHIPQDRFLKIYDVLVNSTGVGTLGRVAQLSAVLEPSTVDSHVTIVRPDPEKVDPYYFGFAVRSIESQIEASGEGSTGQTELSRIRLGEIEIPLPTKKSEQRAIAHTLGSMDDKIELNRKMNETLETMAQALFKSWFVDFDPVIDNAILAGNLIPDEFAQRAEQRRAILAQNQPSPPGRGRGEGLPNPIRQLFPNEFEFTEQMGWIPNGWMIGSLNDMVVLQRGFDLPKTSRTDGACPLLAASGQDGTHNEAKVSGPGVVTGRSGKLGIISFVQEDFWPLNTTLWVKEYKNSTPYHAYYLLNTLELERFNAGSAVPTLNRNHIHGMELLVPPMPIVKEFSKFAQSMFDKRFANLEQVKSIAKLRDTLLPKLLSGELRIPEAEKLVEAVI